MRIRAGVVQDTLDGVQQHLPQAWAVLMEVPERVSLAASLHASDRAGWIAVEAYHAVLGPLLDVVGEPAWRAHQRKHSLGFLEQPLFRTLFQAAMAVFKGNPASVLRMFPAGMDQAYRDHGTVVWRDGPAHEDAGTMEFSNLPQEQWTPLLLDGIMGVFEALVLQCNSTPVDVQVRSRSGSVVVVQVGWRRP